MVLGVQGCGDALWTSIKHPGFLGLFAYVYNFLTIVATLKSLMSFASFVGSHSPRK
jgi:hypothetical protein